MSRIYDSFWEQSITFGGVVWVGGWVEWVRLEEYDCALEHFTSLEVVKWGYKDWDIPYSPVLVWLLMGFMVMGYHSVLSTNVP